jgi:hypothetical protein
MLEFFIVCSILVGGLFAIATVEHFDRMPRKRKHTKTPKKKG